MLWERTTRAACAAGMLVAAASVVFLSALPQSAARMFLWPWCVVYASAVITPWFAVTIRALDGSRPLRLPSRRWIVVCLAVGAAVLLSFAFSPFRLQIAPWLAVPLSGLAWFIISVDFLHYASARDRTRFYWAMGLVGATLCAVSLSLWISRQSFRWTVAQGNPSALPASLLGRLGWFLEGRNDEPLGHFNYTAGFALLFIPWSAWLSWKNYGWRRGVWLALLLANLVVEGSSGSRGGVIGLLASCAAAGCIVWIERPAARRRLLILFGLSVAVMVVLAVLHPGMRARVLPAAPGAPPNLSNAERAGMLSVAWRAGSDRPITGWGVGSVPLFYDRYRGTVDYGAINMLQVHNVPLNLWAEGGILLALSVLAGALVAGHAVFRLARQGRALSLEGVAAAGCSLGGYAVFGLTDYQLDLPLVAMLGGVNLGVLAAAGNPVRGSVPAQGSRDLRRTAGLIGLAATIALGFVFMPWLQSRRALDAGDLERAIALQPADPVLVIMRGLLNAKAARDQAGSSDADVSRNEAVRDLERALLSGAHGEICHFNLGWLELDADRESAGRHFAQVLRIAPSRPGAWLGFALSQSERSRLIDGLAMECLAQPTFLSSGWWMDDRLAAIRPEVVACLLAKLAKVQQDVPAGHWPLPQARYFSALVVWSDRDGSLSAVSAAAPDEQTRAFFTAAAESATAPAASDHLLDDAIAGGMRARRRTGEFLRQASVVPTSDGIEAVLQPIRDLTAAEAMRAMLSPKPGRGFVVVGTFASRAGFGVRQRNPYAQSVLDAMPIPRIVLSECFGNWVWPKPGWIFDQTLWGLADGKTQEAVLQEAGE